eukprot:maker-scaffold1442_size41114-snap-gene-0.21 protein:Tk02303 transcript:maker-scaffold1442_size41114-snap-gene-0.21-mRNA-1 annotation:"PREDICTED: uncharacterized protein LOC101739017"
MVRADIVIWLGMAVSHWLPPGRASIDCFSCSSTNGSNVNCDDPMSPAFVPIERNCLVPKQNHVGKFPANYCIKMVGTSYETKETLVVRTCVLEDMNSQCGTFKFQEDVLKGCLLTCNFDGCNNAMPSHSRWDSPPLLFAAMALVSRIYLVGPRF